MANMELIRSFEAGRCCSVHSALKIRGRDMLDEPEFSKESEYLDNVSFALSCCLVHSFSSSPLLADQIES